MHDLGHAPAFVGRRRTRNILQNNDRLSVTIGITRAREIAGRDSDARARNSRCAIKRIRNDADADIAAKDALIRDGSRRVNLTRVLDHAALGRDRADTTKRTPREHHALHTGEIRDRSGLCDRQPRGNDAVPPVCFHRDDLQTEIGQLGGDLARRGFPVEIDVDHEPPGSVRHDRSSRRDFAARLRLICLIEFEDLLQPEAQIFWRDDSARNRSERGRSLSVRCRDRGDGRGKEDED